MQHTPLDGEDNDEPLMLFVPAGAAMVGWHLGPRTKAEYPYSYDPILQFDTGEQPDGSCYSDRLNGWYGYEAVREAKKRHFGDSGDHFGQRKPKAIEQFLREMLKLPDLKLVRVEEHCNQANGFPCWYFGYQRNDAPKAA